MTLTICSLGIKQHECDNYFIHPSNHEKYHQRVQKSTLSEFDDKRCHEINTEIKP